MANAQAETKAAGKNAKKAAGGSKPLSPAPKPGALKAGRKGKAERVPKSLGPAPVTDEAAPPLEAGAGTTRSTTPLTDEEKKERRRQRRLAKKAAMTDEEKAALREKRKYRRSMRLQKMTPEQQAELKAKRAARRAQRKAKATAPAPEFVADQMKKVEVHTVPAGAKAYNLGGVAMIVVEHTKAGTSVLMGGQSKAVQVSKASEVYVPKEA